MTFRPYVSSSVSFLLEKNNFGNRKRREKEMREKEGTEKRSRNKPTRSFKRKEMKLVKHVARVFGILATR